MATLADESGTAIDQAPAADAARVRVVARIEADQKAAAEPAAPPVKPRAEPGAEQPKRRGRPPKTDKPRAVPKAAVTLTDAERGDGVRGLAQLGAGMFLLASKATGKDAFRADALVIAAADDDLADACVQTAKADAQFAAALDKICAAGPYAALITVGTGLACQIARNHRPALKLPGTKDPAKILQAGAEAGDMTEDSADGPAAAA